MTVEIIYHNPNYSYAEAGPRELELHMEKTNVVTGAFI
jgi:hypothetical protein